MIEIECISKSIKVDDEIKHVWTGNDRYYYLSTPSTVYVLEYVYDHDEIAIEKHIMNTECMLTDIRYGQLTIASRRSVYRLSDGKFTERKYKRRILGVISLANPMLISICKDSKSLQVHLEDSIISLEKFKDKCDVLLLYFNVVSEGVVLICYKTANTIKYAVVCINESGKLILIRHDSIIDGNNVEFTRSLKSNYDFLLLCDDFYYILSYNINIWLLNITIHKLKPPSENDIVKLIDYNTLCGFSLKKDEIHLKLYNVHNYDITSDYFVKTDVNYNGPLKIIDNGDHVNILSIIDNDYHMTCFNVNRLKLNFYKDEEMKYSSIDNKELEEKIRNSDISITTDLVQHIIDKKLVNCAKECLKSNVITELNIIRLVKSDLSLLNDFLLYSKCNETELVKALRSELDKECFTVIIEELFKILEDINDLYFNRRIIGFINILLDAKYFELYENGEFRDEWIEKLRSLVCNCQSEHYNLESLLSFTNTFFYNNQTKSKYPLLSTFNITL